MMMMMMCLEEFHLRTVDFHWSHQHQWKLLMVPYASALNQKVAGSTTAFNTASIGGVYSCMVYRSLRNAIHHLDELNQRLRIKALGELGQLGQLSVYFSYLVDLFYRHFIWFYYRAA